MRTVGRRHNHVLKYVLGEFGTFCPDSVQNTNFKVKHFSYTPANKKEMSPTSKARHPKIKLISIKAINAILELRDANSISDVEVAAKYFQEWLRENPIKPEKSKKKVATLQFATSKTSLQSHYKNCGLVTNKVLHSLIHYIFYISNNQEKIQNKLESLFQQIEPVNLKKEHLILIDRLIRCNIEWAEKEKSITFKESWHFNAKDHFKDSNRIEIPGTITIDENFRESILKGPNFTPEEFYTAKYDSDCQWYGVLNGYAIERKEFDQIKKTISSSFLSPRNDKVCALIHGSGGSGKSTILRAISLDLLKTDLTILWLKEPDSDEFLKTGLSKIQGRPNENFLLVIEDWPKIEAASKFTEIANFFRQISLTPNIQIVIGDRDITGQPYLEHLFSQNHIFKLKSSENQAIISEILKKQPEWKTAASNIFNHPGNYSSSLFLLLFVTSKVSLENDSTKRDKISPENEFRRIITTDLKFINHSFPGLAGAIYFYSCIYTITRITVPYSFLLKLADQLNPNQSTLTELENFHGDSEIHDKIRGFFHLPNTNYKSKNLSVAIFNHDLLANNGVSQIGVHINGVGPFDDLAKGKFLTCLIKITKEDETVSKIVAVYIRKRWILHSKPEILSRTICSLASQRNYHDEYLNALVFQGPNREITESILTTLLDMRFFHETHRSFMELNPSFSETLLRLDNFFLIPSYLSTYTLMLCPCERILQESIIKLLNFDELSVVPSGVISVAFALCTNESLLQKKILTEIGKSDFVLNAPIDTVGTVLDFCSNKALVAEVLKDIQLADNSYEKKHTETKVLIKANGRKRLDSSRRAEWLKDYIQSNEGRSRELLLYVRKFLVAEANRNRNENKF